jgi:hypothetical protein
LACIHRLEAALCPPSNIPTILPSSDETISPRNLLQTTKVIEYNKIYKEKEWRRKFAELRGK